MLIRSVPSCLRVAIINDGLDTISALSEWPFAFCKKPYRQPSDRTATLDKFVGLRPRLHGPREMPMTEFSYVDIACPRCHAKTTLTVAGWNTAAREHSWYDCPNCHKEVEVMLPGRVIWAGERLTAANAAQRLRFLEAVDAAIQQGRQTPARF
jgi:hypothetical protein